MQQLTIGTLLRGGSYKIEKVLGQGSFGITYLAEHTNLGRKVAIKEFFMKELNSRGEDGSITGMTDGSLSQNYCVKFQKEAINLSRLDHTNIVRVTDSFSENGTFYYVMDYIEGQNLNDYIKSHHVDEAEATSIIKSVADALIYMHEEKHMLHLDLKPGNVMRRNSDGQIFLIDFGLSKHFCEDGQPETSTTIGLGTAGYAPIEQGNRAKNGEFRPTIDVYALGATLYKLLTRDTPPEASMLVSDEKLVENNLHEKGIAEYFIDVVVSAMKPSVYERIQTVRDFKNFLIREKKEEETIVLGLEDKHETKSEDIVVETKLPQKHGFVKIIATIFLIAILAGGGIWLSTGREINKEKPVAENLPDSVSNIRMTINGNLCYYTGKVCYGKNDSTAIADGVGEAVFDNGCYYRGAFSNGFMHGSNAFYKYDNGDTFRGSLTNNLFAKGTYTIKESGEYFTGTFDNQGQPKNGTWYDKSGIVLEKIQ